MKMVPVDSSNVAEIGHDLTDLHVLFKNGGRYIYRGVPPALFVQLLNADSVGKELNGSIKPNFSYEKIA